MAFRELVEGIGSGKYGFPLGASTRYKRLDAYERLLNGTIYEHLLYPFDMEVDSSKKYVSLLKRRPSVRYGLPKIIVNQHASMTFGEQHFPHVRCIHPKDSEQTDEQKATEEACQALIRTLKLAAIMQEAIRKGSIGSAALIAKIRDNGMPAIEVVAGKEAKPEIIDEIDYENIPALNRIWDIDGEALSDFGYEVKKEDLQKTFWLRIHIDKTDWTWYKPLTDKQYSRLGEKDENNVVIAWQEDDDRSGAHGFTDRAPAIWLRNFTVGSDALDGVCTFEGPVADDCVAIDYLLSQSGRGLRYSMDPLLVIKMGEMGLASLDLARGQTSSGDIPKTTGILPLTGGDSDAKLLEISGGGFDAAQEFFKKLRELTLETCGGIITGQETKEGPQSGRAIELHHVLATFFTEQLRVCYGDAGLIPLLNLLLVALQSGAIDLQDGEDWSGIDLKTPLSLSWPQWRLPTGADLLAEITALQLVAGGSATAPVALFAPDLASRLAAQKYDIDDPASVAEEAQKHRDEQEQQEQEQAQQQSEQAHTQALEITKAKGSATGGASQQKG